MLLSLMILLASSGRTLFLREWIKKWQSDKSTRMYAGLLTTVHKKAMLSTGMPLTYLEFNSEVALSFAFDNGTEILCALFHDKSDGPEFGRLIAKQILSAFMDEYEKSDQKATSGDNAFYSFESKIIDTIEGSTSKILSMLRAVRGVQSLMLVLDDDTQVEVGQFDDRVGVLSTLPDVLTYANHLMEEKEDGARLITLQFNKKLLNIHQLGNATLVSMCRQSYDREAYETIFAKVERLLNKTSNALSTLRE